MPKTEEELAAEAAEKAKADEQRIMDIANRAAADHAKRAVAKYEKQLEERDQKIAQLEARLSTGSTEPAPKTEGAPAADSASDKRIKELEARMQERDRKLDEERRAREEERKARLRDEEKAATVAALNDAGVTGPLQRAALLSLQEDKRVGRDDAGNICWLEQKEGYVDKIPVVDGVKAWAEGAGKPFLPAKGVGGSGTKPNTGTAGPKSGDKGSKVAQAKRDLANAFFGKTDGGE